MNIFSHYNPLIYGIDKILFMTTCPRNIPVLLTACKPGVGNSSFCIFIFSYVAPNAVLLGGTSANTKHLGCEQQI